MTTPTEEQREAVAKVLLAVECAAPNARILDHAETLTWALAALLAEREAPLRERAKKAEEDAAVLAALIRTQAPHVHLPVVERQMAPAIDRARANLATVQREHDELRRSTEAARAAIAKALGLTEWRALADLATEVARLTALLADAEASVARKKALIDETARRHVAAERALAASRAEVEALRAEVDYAHATARLLQARASDADTDDIGDEMDALWERMGKDGRDRANALAKLLAEGDAALSSTPAPASAEPAWTSKQVIAAAGATFAEYKRNAFQSPHPAVGAEEAFALDVEGWLLRASAEPATPTTSPVCSTCKDTHLMWHSNLEREVMCTRCPTPCRKCAAGGGFGPYCAKTPCACACHLTTTTTEGGAK